MNVKTGSATFVCCCIVAMGSAKLTTKKMELPALQLNDWRPKLQYCLKIQPIKLKVWVENELILSVVHFLSTTKCAEFQFLLTKICKAVLLDV